MHEEPDHPTEEAAEAQRAHASDGSEPPDRGRAAEVPVPEWQRAIAFESSGDRVGGVEAALHGDLRHARQLAQGRHVSYGEHLGIPRQREIRQHLNAAGASARYRWLRPAWLPAARPALQPPRWSCAPRSETGCRPPRRRRPRASTPMTRAPIRSSTPTRSELRSRLRGEPVTERGERFLATVQQECADHCGVEVAELTRGTARPVRGLGPRAPRPSGRHRQRQP